MAPTLPDDPALLKALIAALQAKNAKISAALRGHDQLIQTLRLRFAKLKKQVFGKSSEEIEREIEQLELALEDLLIASTEGETAVPGTSSEAAVLGPAADSFDRLSPRAVVPGSRTARRASGRSWIPAVAAPIAGANCGWWEKISARCWI